MGVLCKGIPINLLVFVIFLVCRKYVCAAETLTRCIESEREALLRFKLSLTDDHGVLSSWGSEDHQMECCKWARVVCSNTTGHVIALQLYGDWSSNSVFGGKISSALLDLHHLTDLDLHYNDFGGIRIPEFFGSIKKLQHLHLSDSNFSGSIPPQLGNLTNLIRLNVFGNYLWSDNLYWLSHLSFLEFLDLSESNISDANWLQHVLNLPSLQTLLLQGCMLADVTKSSVGFFVNSSSSSYSTSLSSLYMSDNELTSTTIFDWLFNISCSYVIVDVSSNQLDGPIPDAFGKQIFLESLDLSGNMIQGGIPKSFRNLSHFQDLDLSGNDLGEPFEELLGKQSWRHLVHLGLTNTKLTGSVTATSLAQLSKLKYLLLSYNSLTIDLSPDWIPPFDLEVIGLAGCKMGPSFPAWLLTQSNLNYLDISDAGILDEVPKWFWNLSPRIGHLNISHNQISGTIPDLSSSIIQIIDVSSNKFSGPVSSLPPSIVVVQLSQNNFSGSISSICTNSSYMNLLLLDLANNHLAGALPECWENMTDLIILNLNNNNFYGEIPHSLGSLWYLETLHLCGNNLSGELPSTFKNFRFLHSIDIGGNKLTGHIPPWLGNGNQTKLAYLSLRQNRFYGGIPPEICNLSLIQMLDLSGNNLSGKIPLCFNKFTSLVDMNGTTTTTIRISIPFPMSIRLSDYIDYALVQWKGQESEYKNTLGLLKLIDLSSNRLVGSIPKAFSSLRGLISMNLSKNSLTGNIDQDIGKMEMLECLDLSRNQLSGEIPIGLAQLYRLAVLHLENNNLSGKIPSSTQLQSFNESDFAGNDKLCGKPLKLCPEDELKPSKEGEDIKEKDEGFLRLSLMEEFGISMGFGFIVGFWGVVGSLLLKKSWRSAYCNFLDVVGDWLCVTTTIFLTKLKRS